MHTIKHKDDHKKGEFIIYEDNKLAGHMKYKYQAGKVIDIYETEVDKAYEGKGLASKLFNKAIEFAKENELKIIPTCSFVAHKLDKNESLKSFKA